MMRNIFLICFFLLGTVPPAFAIQADALYDQLNKKVLTVKDYTAQVKLKIDVNYMRVPQLNGTMFFKSPNKMRLERKGGLSILPKKNINLTLSNLIPTGKVAVLDQGTALYNGRKLRVLKIVPDDDQNQIILTKLWIDEDAVLVIHLETTTRNDGTIMTDMEYNNYASYALPDKVKILLDLKDYKLPKGITFDYDEWADTKTTKPSKSQKGTIEIFYSNYTINKGLSDLVFNKTND